jgi:hypothetical protein
MISKFINHKTYYTIHSAKAGKPLGGTLRLHQVTQHLVHDVNSNDILIGKRNSLDQNNIIHLYFLSTIIDVGYLWLYCRKTHLEWTASFISCPPPVAAAAELVILHSPLALGRGGGRFWARGGRKTATTT